MVADSNQTRQGQRPKDAPEAAPANASDAHQLCARLDRILRLNSQYASETAPSIIAELGVHTVSLAVQTSSDPANRATWWASPDAVSPETTFQACSISKTMTALAVMRLIDQGRMHLEDCITKHLPPWVIKAISTPNTERHLSQVTILHLLSHTSGLGFQGCAGYIDPTRLPTAEQLLAGAPPSNRPQIRLEGLPGDGYAYSGGGYIILQIMLEYMHPSSPSFDHVMQMLVFKPLGMHRSSFPGTRMPSMPHAAAHFTAATPCDVPLRFFPEQAAAGLWTTPSDLLKAAHALQQSLELPDGTGFLRRGTAAEMVRVHTPINYGLGIIVGEGVLGHSGWSEPGWSCWLLCFTSLPREEYPAGRNRGSLAVMTNSPLGSRLMDKLINAVAYLHNLPRVDGLGFGLKKGVTPFADPDASIPAEYAAWDGEYDDGWELSTADASLTIGGIDPIRIYPAAIPKGNDGQPYALSIDGMIGMHIQLATTDGTKTLEVWREGTACTMSRKRRRDDSFSTNHERQTTTETETT